MVGGPGGTRRSDRVRDGRGDICDRASWAAAAAAAAVAGRSLVRRAGGRLVVVRRSRLGRVVSCRVFVDKRSTSDGAAVLTRGRGRVA